MAIIEDMIEGIRFLVEQVIKTAPYDKTDTAIVTGTTEFGYSISYNNQIYKDIKTTGGSCYVNETVRIVIPQNNMSNMFILKSPTSDDVSNLQSQINLLNTRFEKYYSLVKDNSVPYIATNANINDYRTPGNYYCSANAIAKTLLNVPSEIVTGNGGAGTAFSLKVEYIIGDSGYISQTLNTYNTGNIYYRVIYVPTNTWGGWRAITATATT